MGQEQKEIIAFTHDQLKERFSVAHEVHLSPDIDATQNRILMMSTASDAYMNKQSVTMETMQLLLVANDLVSACPALAIDFYRPALDKSVGTFVGLFRESNIPIGKSFRGEKEGSPKSDQHVYTCQPVNNRSIYPRDILQMAQVKGRRKVLLSEPISDDNMTNYALAYAINRDLGQEIGMIPLNFEGGNVIIGDNQIFTLQDFAHRNGFTGIRENGIIPVETQRKKGIDFGKPIIVLDHELASEGKQRVFHLDMLLSAVKGADGKEYFLLASPKKAQQILSEKNLWTKPRQAMNVGRWTEIAGYKSYFTKEIEKFTMQVLTKNGLWSEQPLSRTGIQEMTEKLKSFFSFPAYAFKDIGISLDEFFTDSNMVPLTEYVNVIRQNLNAVGIPDERIIDVPALVFCDDYHETNMRQDGLHIESKRKIPMYSPVNGIQQKGAEGENSIYLTGGGIRPFDEYLRDVLQTIGVKHIPIPSLIGLGYGSAGLRCTALPL